MTLPYCLEAVFTAAGNVLHHMLGGVHGILGYIIIFQGVNIGEIFAVIIEPAGFIQANGCDDLLLICPYYPWKNMIL